MSGDRARWRPRLHNLGNTFGHAIENAAGYGEYLHGEAVAIGLCAAARCRRNLVTSAGDFERLERVVTAHALPTRLRAPLAYPELHAAMTRDKEVRAGGCASSCCAGSARRRRRPTCRRVGRESFHEVGAA